MDMYLVCILKFVMRYIYIFVRKIGWYDINWPLEISTTHTLILEYISVRISYK